MKYAMIRDGVVFNVAVWDGESAWEPGCEVVDITGVYAGVGWSWDGNTFTAPPEVPEVEDAAE